MQNTFTRVSGIDSRPIAKPHALGFVGQILNACLFSRLITGELTGGHLSTVRDLGGGTIVPTDSGVIDEPKGISEEGNRAESAVDCKADS